MFFDDFEGLAQMTFLDFVILIIISVCFATFMTFIFPWIVDEMGLNKNRNDP